MRKKFFMCMVTILTITSMLLMSGSVFGYNSKTQSVKRKIVVFRDDIKDEITKETVLKKSGGIKIKNLKLVNGVAAYLSEKAETLLAGMKEVKRIDDDVNVNISKKPVKPPKPEPAPPPSQSLPWGIDRIDAELAWGTTNAPSVKVAVLDTGIDMSHPDLSENIKGGFNAILTRKSATDDNGHGTHVAGIIAALNNSIGVVGAGPEIDLYAVKVLDRKGSGYLSDIIEGIGWCIDNNIQVINMSLGTSYDVPSFHEAVIQAQQAGIVLVAAAGNNYGSSVDYPAAYTEVIAVSATDMDNNIAYFSSVGHEVDVAAPGVNIYSTYKGSEYAEKSGTSMAAPHVSGAAALLLSVYSTFDADEDGSVTPVDIPIGIQQKLMSTATDLGSAGQDNFYGAGLVNVYQAVSQ